MKAVIKKSSMLMALITFPLFAVAQFDSLGLSTEWYQGNILLKDNSELSGLIQYNDKLGLIKLRQNPEDEEKTFMMTNVLLMDFFDSRKAKHRKFASLDVKSDEIGWKGKIFFEIIMELKEFALLSKLDPVNVAVRNRSNQNQIAYAKVGYEQFERICLVGQGGSVEVLLVVNDFEKDKSTPFAGRTQPYFNKEVMERAMGLNWQQVNLFVKENKLNLNKRDDLIKAFDYYSILEKE